MLYGNSWLKICSQLKDISTQHFEAGDRIARGFADLGFEEYLLLPNEKILSLYTASVVPFPSEHKHHFFKVLSTVQLSNYLIAKNLDFVLRTSDNQFTCEISDLKFSGNSIEQVLMEAVKHVSNS